MSYFLYPEKLSKGKIFDITGKEARHISLSRRIRVAEKILLQDNEGKRFRGQVVEVSKNNIKIEIEEEIKTPDEPKIEITLFQPLIKEKALDFIIQKTTELGLKNLIIFPSLNSPIDTNKIEKRLDRWNKISEEAAKQSGRVTGLNIKFLNDIDQAILLASTTERVFILDQKGNGGFLDFYKKDKKAFKNISVFLGPEGGLNENEVTKITSLKNCLKIKMGPRTLRADTAALSSVAIIGSIWGDID